MKFTKYGIEFKLEALVTSESVEIIITNDETGEVVIDDSIYLRDNPQFDLAEYMDREIW